MRRESVRFCEVQSQKRLYQVNLVLTEKEARKLVEKLEKLLRDPEKDDELFLQSDDSPEELTANIITERKLQTWKERGEQQVAWMRLLGLKPRAKAV